MIRAAIISLAVASPGVAEELRAAPAYYTDTVFAVSMAEALAKGCAALGLNFFEVQTQLETLEAKLGEDGFDINTPFEQMVDPTPVFAGMQQSFLAKYPIEGAPEAEVCAAGRTERRDGTQIGALLIDEKALPE